MGKYQTYSEYRSWNNKWISCLPASWQLVPLKYICSGFVKDGPHETPKFTDDGIPFLSVDGIQDNKLVFNGCRYISEEDHVRYSMKCHPKQGDVLLGKAASVGKVAYVDSNIDFNVWSPLAVITAKSNKYGKYIYYCLQSSMLQAQCEVFANSNTQKNLGMNTIDNLDMPLPSENEADAITNFLDHETAKIDTLIEKQQQLIKLLKEKRQAVISHAVTNGLNPQAPMKDSGVEWLGEVPEHWVVSRIKNFAKIDSGHTPSRQVEEYWIDCNIPWVSLNDSKTLKVVDYIDDTSNKINELGMANSSAHLLPERSVVFTRDASIGLSAIMSKPMAVSQHLIAWICNDSKLIPEFLLLIFYAMEKEFERYTFGATIKTIGMDDVRSLSGAFPPLEEQKVLVEWAFQKMASLKNGIDKAESVVDLLKERRTALISAAVTGKIDVRNWQRNRLTSEDECSDAV